MKLTAKFLVAFLLTTLALVAINAVLRVEREMEHFDAMMRQHTAEYGESLAHALSIVAKSEGAEEATELVTHVAQVDRLRTRWVTLDANRPDLSPPLLPRAPLARQLAAGSVAFHELPGRGGVAGTLLAYVPLPKLRGTALEVVESLEARDRFLHETILRMVWLSVSIVVGTTVVALLVGLVVIARPVHELRLKVRRVAGGDLTGPLIVRGHDELKEVAEEINLMCEQLTEARHKVAIETAARIAALEQVRHSDRLATTGRLAAGIAHEIGTPLAVVAGRAQLIARGEVQGSEAKDSARVIGEQTQRITAIIRQLLDFARKRPASKARVNLVELAHRTSVLLQPLAQKRSLTLSATTAESDRIMAEVDAGQIEQALTNLIVNALHATASGGKVDVACGRARAAPPLAQGGAGERDLVTVCIEDTGSGMSPETTSHLFEPFYTTKEVGDGSGLGLAVTHGIVAEHGGFITVTSELGKGSRFVVHLPACDELDS